MSEPFAMSPTSDTPVTSNSPIVRNLAARVSQSFASPTSDTPVASDSPFVRSLIARALRRAPRMDASAFNTTPSQFPVVDVFNETSEGTSKSTGRLSGNTLASNRKRRASALEGTATNRPQHCNRTLAPVAIENELEDYDEEERNGSIAVGPPTHANELEDYDESERNGSVVTSPPTHTNEIEDYNEETLGTSSNASLPPSPKKLCTGLSYKVLVIDGEKFLLPEGRGDVVTLEHDEAMFGRAGHMMHPEVIVIDGQRFLLPRGGGEVVALGWDERMWMEEMRQRELNYAGVEEGDRQQEQETDSELEDWINNYHCYMDSRDEEGQVLQDEEGQQKEQEVNDLDQFRPEEPGNTYFPDVEEEEQTMQNDTAGPSSDNSLCIYCGEYHLSEQSDCEDSESNASEPASENSLCPQCGVYHPPGQMESDASDSDTTEPLGYFLCNNCGEYHLSSEDEEESTDWESDEHEDSSVYDEQEVNVEADINNDEVPPTDSGYDSEMDEEDDSDSSDSSDSDSSLGSDESVDWDYDYDSVGGGDANAQAPALVVDDPILYGPTDLPEGHVRGDMMFVLNGELWGIDFRN